MSNTDFSAFVCLFFVCCFCCSEAMPTTTNQEPVNDRPIIGKSNVPLRLNSERDEEKFRGYKHFKNRGNGSFFVTCVISFHRVFTAAVFLSHRCFDADSFR